jgi:hypothetical protein
MNKVLSKVTVTDVEAPRFLAPLVSLHNSLAERTKPVRWLPLSQDSPRRRSTTTDATR